MRTSPFLCVLDGFDYNHPVKIGWLEQTYWLARLYFFLILSQNSSLNANKEITKTMELYFFWLPPLNKKNDVQAQLFVHSIMKEVQIGNEIRGERKAKDQDLKLY